MVALGVVDSSGTCNLHPTASCARENSQYTPLPILNLLSPSRLLPIGGMTSGISDGRKEKRERRRQVKYTDGEDRYRTESQECHNETPEEYLASGLAVVGKLDGQQRNTG